MYPMSASRPRPPSCELAPSFLPPPLSIFFSFSHDNSSFLPTHGPRGPAARPFRIPPPQPPLSHHPAPAGRRRGAPSPRGPPARAANDGESMAEAVLQNADRIRKLLTVERASGATNGRRVDLDVEKEVQRELLDLVSNLRAADATLQRQFSSAVDGVLDQLIKEATAPPSAPLLWSQTLQSSFVSLVCCYHCELNAGNLFVAFNDLIEGTLSRPAAYGARVACSSAMGELILRRGGRLQSCVPAAIAACLRNAKAAEACLRQSALAALRSILIGAGSALEGDDACAEIVKTLGRAQQDKHAGVRSRAAAAIAAVPLGDVDHGSAAPLSLLELCFRGLQDESMGVVLAAAQAAADLLSRLLDLNLRSQELRAVDAAREGDLQESVVAEESKKSVTTLDKMRAGLKDMGSSSKMKRRLSALEGVTSLRAAVALLKDMLPRLPEAARAARSGLFLCWAALLEQNRDKITDHDLRPLLLQALDVLDDAHVAAMSRSAKQSAAAELSAGSASATALHAAAVRRAGTRVAGLLRAGVAGVLRRGLGVSSGERLQLSLLRELVALCSGPPGEGGAPLGDHQLQVCLAEVSHLAAALQDAAAPALEELQPALLELCCHDTLGLRLEAAVALSALLEAVPQALPRALPLATARLEEGLAVLEGAGAGDKSTLCALHGCAALLCQVVQRAVGGAFVLREAAQDELWALVRRMLAAQATPALPPQVRCTCVRAGWALAASLLRQGEAWAQAHADELIAFWRVMVAEGGGGGGRGGGGGGVPPPATPPPPPPPTPPPT